jgi:isopentenyl diphosphate isomerase/L-lactate dehydrogenase-like FMN-dependent dehydrogenase
VTFANLVDVVPGDVAEIAAYVDRELGAATASWDDLDRLRRRWDGPLVVKGVLSVEDAHEAVRRGADAVYVSNHGGRQLDGSPATLDVLPRIAEAVGDRVEVLLDGGVRRGEDAVRARALGARAVLVGRPWVHALAAGGEEVVARQLALLRDGVDRTLALLGVPRLDDVGPAVLAPSPVAPNDRLVDTSAPR